MKEWFTASELAGLPGLPKTKQGVNKMVLKEGWLSRPRKGHGGGKEHHVSNLKDITVNALYKRNNTRAAVKQKAVIKKTVQCPFLPLRLAVNKLISQAIKLFNINGDRHG